MREFAAFVVRRARFVVAAWCLALLALLAVAGAAGPSFSTAFEIPASESASGFELLRDRFGGAGTGQSGAIVFTAPDVLAPEVRASMEEMFAAVSRLEGVTVLSPYLPQFSSQVNANRTVAYASLGLDPSLDQADLARLGGMIVPLIPQAPGLQVEISGQALAEFHPPESEALGLAFAVVILVVSFGSVLAMGLSVANALAGVAAGSAVVIALSNVVSMPDFSTTLGAMLGIAVGIDYALFIITRVREFRDSGFALRESVVRALDTAGRAVLFAGVTVVASLLGMLLVGLRFVTGLAIGASVAVAFTLAASMTLLPALVSLVGDRIEVSKYKGAAASALVALGLLGVGFSLPVLYAAFPLAVALLVIGTKVAYLSKSLPPRRRRALESTWSYRWSRKVQLRPLRYLCGALALLLALTAPVFSLRLGFSDEGNFTPDTTTRRAYDLLASGFGPGVNGPLIVVGEYPDAPDDLTRLRSTILEQGSVAFASPPMPNDLHSPTAFVIQVIPASSPQSEETTELVHSLRDALGSTHPGLEVYITGPTAASVDFTGYLTGRLVAFIAGVLFVSFLLLLAVFRSVLVPVKAVLMNILSISAAYGVVVAIFQWGWFGSLFGVAPAPVEPFIPMMMFAILFGLSMDYEVFLLSRVKEEFVRTGDPRSSVADGLAATARVITAAAAIMVVVFAGFLFEDARIIKLFGVGLSTAVLLDATLVRMVLVPSTMELLGARNWWFPRVLERVVPRLNVEGPAPDED